MIIINMKIKERLSMMDAENHSQNQQLSSLRENNYVRGENSGKWSEQEHMRYIAFLDHNKEKMKSKQKRRSNKFYQEMSAFISTRNALQCRSHHQKLQEKYVNISKIIFLYKNTFESELYNQIFQNIKKFYTEKHHFYKYQNDLNHQKNCVQIQTDIGGMQLEFITINPNLILIRKKVTNDATNQQNQMTFNPAYAYTNIYNPMQYSISSIDQSSNAQLPGLFIPSFNQN